MKQSEHTNILGNSDDFREGATSLTESEKMALAEAEKVGALDAIEKLLINRQKYFIHKLVEAEDPEVSNGLRGAITCIGSIPALIQTEIVKLENNNEDD